MVVVPGNMVHADIVSFIKACKIATVCCVHEDDPHAFTCFYVFDEGSMVLVFKSSDKSRHAALLAANPHVSGTIISPAASPHNNSGIQFEGVIVEKGGSTGQKEYYLRYPFAIAIEGSLYAIQVNKIKLTKTVLGVRTKEQWIRL